MKILWFSHFIPFPPRGGNLQRSFNLIHQASKSYEITLVALNFLGDPPQQLRSYADELKKYCEDVLIWELPHPWRGARWWAELSWSPLFRYPLSCRALFSRENLSRWKEILREHPGALLHFDSIDLALFASAANGFRKVLNHHNCESAMACRRARGASNPLKRTYLRMDADRLAKLEGSVCGNFDVNLAVSEQDVRLLRINAPAARIHVVENGVDTHYFKPTTTEQEHHSLVFTGSMDWYPNVSGLRFFVREAWPLIKSKFPQARLYLAGKNPPREIMRWPKADSSIVVVANPDDVRPWMARSAVCVCPILEGGGTRLKILDAMAMAKPVVSTAIGCEGLRAKHGENILVADTPQEFAEKVSQLLENEGFRRQLGCAGRELVEREYSWETIGQQLGQAYRWALEQGKPNQRTCSNG